MAELLSSTDKRTNYCGTLRRENIGEHVCVMGWAARVRDLGSLIFIDLRDRTGIVQLAFDENTDKEIFDKAFRTRTEYVIVAKGTVRLRSSINAQIPTGEVEVFVDEYKILSAAQTTPFEDRACTFGAMMSMGPAFLEYARRSEYM